MTWHTVVVATEEFPRSLGSIRQAGGIIIHSRPCHTGVLVTYVTRGG